MHFWEFSKRRTGNETGGSVTETIGSAEQYQLHYMWNWGAHRLSFCIIALQGRQILHIVR